MTPRVLTVLRVVLAAPLAGCPASVNHVDLVLAQTAAGQPFPLMCRVRPTDGGVPGADGGGFLIWRARAAGRVSVVVDFLGIPGGEPQCLPQSLVRWCATHCCHQMIPARVCSEILLGDGGPLPIDPRALAAQIQQGLRGVRITSDAPNGQLMVRAVVTTERCADLSPGAGAASIPRFDSDHLVGCAYSCPVTLDAVSGSLELGLPAFNDLCEPIVEVCATAFEDLSQAGCDAGP